MIPPAADQRAKTDSRQRLVRALTAVNVGFLLLLWLIEKLVAEGNWLIMLALYAPQHPFGVPSAVLLLWSTVRRDRRALAINGVAVLFFALSFLGFNIPLRAGRSTPGRPIRVMTFNIHHGSRGGAEIVNVIERVQPDVVCVQEVNAARPWPDPLPALKRLLTNRELAWIGELAIFSRYPIVSQKIHWAPRPTARTVLEAVINVNGKKVTILNVHFSTAARFQSLTRRSISLPAYLRHTADMRSEQVSFLLGIVEQTSTPVIIAGDFNTPARGRLYEQMTRRCEDAFRAAGWGMGYTYRASLPVMRIDYLFLGRGLGVNRCFVPRTRASDHRPVVADVACGE